MLSADLILTYYKVGRICKAKKIVKAFGKAGDMVNNLDGGSSTWVAKWQAKVVAAAATVVNDRDAKRLKIICIDGVSWGIAGQHTFISYSSH